MKTLPARLVSGFSPRLGLVVAALLAGGTNLLVAQQPGEAPVNKSPVPIKRVMPVHPKELQKKFLQGHAVVECVVTEKGTVEDVKTVSATQPEFGKAAEDAVRQWEFRPAERDGHPVAVRLQIPFEFTLTAEQIIETMLERKVFQEIKDIIVPAREMPSWPRPVQYLLPRYPETLKGSGKYGKAVVTIIINKEGKVMNPKIVKATYPEFMLPALVTAARLEFPPQVMANNEHIHVSMDIQFDFKPDSDKPKGKETPKKQ